MGRDGTGWDGMGRDSMGRNGTGWDGMRWDAMGCDAMGRNETGWDGAGKLGRGGMGWVETPVELKLILSVYNFSPDFSYNFDMFIFYFSTFQNTLSLPI